MVNHTLMCPKRSADEICIQILRACESRRYGTITKLEIMHSVYISYGKADKHLTRLVSDGLLEYNEGLKRYKITDQGLTLLNSTLRKDKQAFEVSKN